MTSEQSIFSQIQVCFSWYVSRVIYNVTNTRLHYNSIIALYSINDCSKVYIQIILYVVIVFLIIVALIYRICTMEKCPTMHFMWNGVCVMALDDYISLCCGLY